jgi:formate-dependent nitrite reductase cytochrome c552 subunit
MDTIVKTWLTTSMRKYPITKYMKIIINAISHRFFLKYIPTPSEKSLYNIITMMQNMVKCIDNCHIPLYEKSNKKKFQQHWIVII